MTEVLHEKAFRKQGAVSLIGKVGRNKGRWYRNVGLGIKVSFVIDASGPVHFLCIEGS